MAAPKKKTMTGAFAAVLAKTESTKTSTKKSSTAEITNPPTNVAEAVDHFSKAKEEYEAAKADMAFHRDDILQFFHEIQDNSGFDGMYQNSYKIFGNHTHVTVSAINRFSINPDDETKIKAIVGKNFFDFLFEKRYTVKLKDEVINNPDKQEELMNLLGQDKFIEFFDTDMALTTKPGFTKEIYGIVDRESLAKLREVITQARASVK